MIKLDEKIDEQRLKDIKRIAQEHKDGKNDFWNGFGFGMEFALMQLGLFFEVKKEDNNESTE